MVPFSLDLFYPPILIAYHSLAMKIIYLWEFLLKCFCESPVNILCFALHCLFAVRIRDHIIGTMEAHEQEVCGLKWSPSGQQLASGGNDNLLHIWDAAAASTQGPSPYLHRLDEHRAAVKALAWCPFQSNLLASGGGTADRCIKFWNTHTGACLNSVDTQSQVLLWPHLRLILKTCWRLVGFVSRRNYPVSSYIWAVPNHRFMEPLQHLHRKF